MSQDKPVLTCVGKYIDLYRECCGTMPMLNNQECEVINRLSSWICQQAALTGWISVEDGLPEARYGNAGGAPIVSDDVLAFFLDAESPYTVCNYDYEESSWYIAETLAQADCDPTHWMPLPPAPHASAQTAFRACGVCSVRDIPFGVVWECWHDGRPCHPACYPINEPPQVGRSNAGSIPVSPASGSPDGDKS